MLSCLYMVQLSIFNVINITATVKCSRFCPSGTPFCCSIIDLIQTLWWCYCVGCICSKNVSSRFCQLLGYFECMVVHILETVYGIKIAFVCIICFHQPVASGFP
jgi:hypothetical protein